VGASKNRDNTVLLRGRIVGGKCEGSLGRGGQEQVMLGYSRWRSKGHRMIEPEPERDRRGV
jgi:hypothetical protein